MTWGFYERQAELRQLAEVLARGRWFFVKLTGPATHRQDHAHPASAPGRWSQGVLRPGARFRVGRCPVGGGRRSGDLPGRHHATLYEERSRKGVGDFALTSRIHGFWDRNDTEIDLVALSESERRIRFESCKCSADRLVSDLSVLDGHVSRFLAAHSRDGDWRVEKVSIAPRIAPELRARLQAAGHIAQDLTDLTADFLVMNIDSRKQHDRGRVVMRSWRRGYRPERTR